MAISDPNLGEAQTTLGNPASGAFSVTPADDTDLTYYTRALYVGGAGNVEVITMAGETVVFVGVPAGTILPIRVSRVKATNTTATSILGLY